MLDVLIASDDLTATQQVAAYFRNYAVEARVVPGSQELRAQLSQRQPSLVILDFASGLELLREIRCNSDVPVIMVDRLTAEGDRVASLEAGADDHLNKPLRLRELLARVRAIVRRDTPGNHASRTKQPGFRFGQFRLVGRHLSAGDGSRAVNLSRGDLRLLRVFLHAPHRAWSREELIAACQMPDDVFDRSIDLKVLRLRRKLQSSAGGKVIETLRGVGYRFTLSVEPI